MKKCMRQGLVKNIRLVLFAEMCILWAGLSIPAILHAETNIRARYVRAQGTQLVIEITVGSNQPASAILIQHLPPGVRILSSQPEAKHYSEDRNRAKWLFRNLQPGVSTVSMTLDRAVSKTEISGEVRFKPQPEGTMVTIAVE